MFGLRSGDVAWLALGIGIVAYESWCPEGELLSQAYDVYVDRFPVLSRVLPMLVTLHVINCLPRRVDPVTGLFVAARTIKGKFRGGRG